MAARHARCHEGRHEAPAGLRSVTKHCARGVSSVERQARSRRRRMRPWREAVQCRSAISYSAATPGLQVIGAPATVRGERDGERRGGERRPASERLGSAGGRPPRCMPPPPTLGV
ncbi:hypothetical protein BU26DRAFT_505659 [Trematosphaeria pertusa]|uniref:Uncharacterized protein n=1 Tax=Trematosphaeria pertusa TaxID=390896 RepID=A0A6A6IBC4_9PLEO|nr:uncharacterized protein BU26DRAFT_505659 [Trematosphaeria pertusa]KAF2247875.1 hypothetical protein BU26DRAFT_505659 [Trematosphaeria pertusa]